MLRYPIKCRGFLFGRVLRQAPEAIIVPAGGQIQGMGVQLVRSSTQARAKAGIIRGATSRNAKQGLRGSPREVHRHQPTRGEIYNLDIAYLVLFGRPV
jgi:hypothetical protein